MRVANQYYEAERIIDEKVTDETTFYLVKWKGMDKNKRPWKPTWEPASHCNQLLIASWNHPRERKLSPPTLPRIQPDELQTKRMISLLEVQCIELDIELTRLKSVVYNNEQEIHKLREETEALKETLESLNKQIEQSKSELENLSLLMQFELYEKLLKLVDEA
ncbi:9549_t:CDS:2, partial [Funneliformis caledonium]